ncbi:Hypothetical predicted protein [Octopus vulgaris]|uniref:Uncharacterized protein n=1 Tax=Octopus vulgaris TaxID=6645 RepID=A0AA36BDR8_OCTVU|nr:Hypothetical predicted protein [Octopus vulgaris]
MTMMTMSNLPQGQWDMTRSSKGFYAAQIMENLKKAGIEKGNLCPKRWGRHLGPNKEPQRSRITLSTKGQLPFSNLCSPAYRLNNNSNNDADDDIIIMFIITMLISFLFSYF